ncbi:large neutral amino acids transporter small subunit 4-like [Mercenaria mercenaria]|uniref:large neutral amino acids transporter small subunit 4-like n=1 Tax=Mercenaria mercenaria TaxID=6596 RepID=UPI00234F5881|nr:large neutral amino acids transporter small subunit 4-like [Mercenaria mercenaria]
MCVQGLRFVSFLGFFNTWLENKFNGNTMKENYYLGVFSYVTMATVITAITAGMLHDCQRRKYMMTDNYKRRRLPVILPLTVTSLMSIIITSLIYVEIEAFLNLVFVLFTIYRSYLFSYEITFLNDVYPLTSFSVLFGVLHSSAGLSGLLQYPVFEWYKSYTAAPNHVNIFLICLAVSSLAHPFSLWYRCRKHRNDESSKYVGTEIYI